MIHWIELHPYWSAGIFVYLCGLGLVVYAVKKAPTMDDNGNFISKKDSDKIKEQERLYH